MAKKKKRFQESTIENYYDLKVDKIDELVAALKDGAPADDAEISMNINDCTGVDDPANVKRGKQKQFNPYKTDFLRRVPNWLKAIFIKWWFSGCVCFFILFGLYMDRLDSLVLCGAVMGIVVDLLVNPLFKYMESDEREYDDFMMFPFPFKAFWTFFTNILYYIAVMLCVNLCYTGINELVNLITHRTNYVSVGIEPLLFGVICVAVDMAFIGIKDGIVRLVKHVKSRRKDLNV